MRNGKLHAFVAMTILGIALWGIFHGATSKAQTQGPRPLQVSDIEEVGGFSSTNPGSNYPAPNPSASGQEVAYDNSGISIFLAPSADSPIKTDPNGPECGHLGIQEWKGSTYAYKLFSNPIGPYANQWQKRKSQCSGYVVVGASEKIGAQMLTLKGTAIDGKKFNLRINVPDPATWDTEVGGGSRRLYVDDTGATYACKSSSFTSGWPNECEFSPNQAVARAPVGAGIGLVEGNGICQAGESASSSDCADTTPPVINPSSVAVSNMTVSGATFTWSTNENTDAQIEYGTTASYGTLSPLDATMAATHTMTLTGLLPNTTYFARIKSRDAAGNAAAYTTSFATHHGFQFANHQGYSSVEAKAGNRARSIFKLENTAAVESFFNIACTATQTLSGATFQTVNADGTSPVPVTGGKVTVPAGTVKYVEHSFDAAGLSAGSVSLTCTANRDGNPINTGYASDSISVTIPAASSGGAALTVSAMPMTNLGANKYTIKIEDPDGIKEFTVKKSTGSVFYSGSPGSSGNYNACGGAAMKKSVESSTVTLETADFPIQATVTDCRVGAVAAMMSVSAPYVVPPPSPPPGGGTGPAIIVNPLTNLGSNKYTLKVEDADGIKEFLIKKNNESTLYGGSPGASGNSTVCTGSSPVKSVESGTLTLESSDFPLNAWLADCLGNGGSAYPFPVPIPGGVTPPPPPVPPTGGDTVGRACKAGEDSCPKGSWCSGGGQQCYYPDSRLTCVPWVTPSGGMAAAMGMRCPS
ncbi:fibronectin type III domain-containing protein, partial [Candidatus Peregrinibacteria bacterium]|nr:fibronectin type III domain-containing protein [Candidatus Peregrinibacteria bacterium]